MRAQAISNPLLALFYVLLGANYEPVGYVDTSPWFHNNYNRSPEPDKPKEKKKKSKADKRLKTEYEPVKSRSREGIQCRGVWIDLSEDADGCWLKTPYYIGVKADSFHVDTQCVHRCITMNDVRSAANAGLLFPDETSATLFLMKLQQENDRLNRLGDAKCAD